MNLPHFIHNQVLIKLFNFKINLNVFYVSFINLLVALAVTTANASNINVNDVNKKQKMYQSYVLVCLNGEKPDTENCEQLTDVRGPYKTEEECIERAIEIRDDLPKYRKAYYAVGYLCEIKSIEEIRGEIKNLS